MLEFGALASRWWMPVLFVVIAGHITNVCVTLFLHRAQTHRGVQLHAFAALPTLDAMHRIYGELVAQSPAAPYNVL